jgi:hypothetical protein
MDEGQMESASRADSVRYAEAAEAGRFPVLDSAQLELLRPYGTEEEVRSGETVLAEGQANYDLIVVLDGELQLVARLVLRTRWRASTSVRASLSGR